MNLPTRGLGKGAKAILNEYKKVNGLQSLYEVLEESQKQTVIAAEVNGEKKQLSKQALNGIKQFLQPYISLRELIEHDLELLQSPDFNLKGLNILNEQGYLCPKLALSHLLVETGYLKSLEKEDPITAASQWKISRNY